MWVHFLAEVLALTFVKPFIYWTDHTIVQVFGVTCYKLVEFHDNPNLQPDTV